VVFCKRLREMVDVIQGGRCDTGLRAFVVCSVKVWRRMLLRVAFGPSRLPWLSSSEPRCIIGESGPLDFAAGEIWPLPFRPLRFL